ncbi:hypothetical protein H8N03_19570 [Ramlibacter sp. USB13]|uniref:Preprotein translocase subunit YajC n=1 Tax=Ramlibacter cellulosilyticus TaxID=2764187 RepID=A0A923SCN7_9BURK|nr:PP0621 family protein [Ramlibacter cellulosilyticus]MBC5785156.1 hypothetical protein [Ramlibacter cellulosilyticus]
MKYLVLLAVLVIAYMVWRNNRLEDRRRDAPPPPRRPGAPQEMVRCASCGLHLPQSDALPGPAGQFYCCKEHRLRAGG